MLPSFRDMRQEIGLGPWAFLAIFMISSRDMFLLCLAFAGFILFRRADEGARHCLVTADDGQVRTTLGHLHGGEPGLLHQRRKSQNTLCVFVSQFGSGGGLELGEPPSET